MYLSQWILPSLILANKAICALAQPLSLPQLSHSLEDHQTRRTAEELERRTPQQTNSDDNLSLNGTSTQSNVSTAEVCTAALSSVTSVSNPAGFAACYNILAWDQDTESFQADLRLYQVTNASGEFASVAMSDIALLLDFPDNTAFQILMNSKRDVSTVSKRQSGMTEIQQYSLLGHFKTHLNLAKLNETELVSLMVPQIVLDSKATNQPHATANLSSTDIAYFLTGEFTNLSSSQLTAQVTNPELADFALTASEPFVLPGTTFGIFPIGLVITGSWTFLFVLAFGLGTIGRIRYRQAYRKRIALETARTIPQKI